MGISSSRPRHSSNDYELAIKSSKEMEHILEVEFNATGRGLHEKITSASSQLPPHLVKKMRYLATIRNKLIHERGFDSIPDRTKFIENFEKSADELHQIITTKGGTSCVIS